MPRPLAPKGGNDRVYTPPELARQIVRHFDPQPGLLLDPCAGPRGKQAFFEAMQNYIPYEQDISEAEWFEIDEGRDFFVPTPPKPWPQTGFALGAVHIQRGYTGPVTFSKL